MSSGDLSRLARSLRVVGAVLLVASASTFMVNRWGRGNDLLRYGLLLGHTLVLAGASYIVGLRVRESRSARTFLALVLAVVPVHFAVLGGLLYSQFALDLPAGGLPQNSMWMAPNPLAALATVSLGLAVLAPLTFVAHVALARPAAKKLTVLYLAANSSILLPVRDPNLVAILLAVVSLALLRAQFRLADHKGLGTPEGAFVRALLLAPPVLLMARALYLYDPADFLNGVFLLLSGYALFEAATRRIADSTLAASLQAVSAVVACAGWYFLSSFVQAETALPEGAELPALVLPYAVVLAWMGRRAQYGKAYERLAAVLALGCVLVNVISHQDAYATIACLAVGIALVAVGATARRRLELGAGTLAVALGLLVHLHRAVRVEAFANWGTLSVLGVLAVVCAAYCERYADKLGPALRRWGRGREGDAGAE